MICLKYKPYETGALRGFADIFVPEWGVEIYGFPYFEKKGDTWVKLPSKEYEQDGEKKYSPYFKFPDLKDYTRFLGEVKEAIETKTKGNSDEFDSEICF